MFKRRRRATTRALSLTVTSSTASVKELHPLYAHIALARMRARVARVRVRERMKLVRNSRRRSSFTIVSAARIRRGGRTARGGVCPSTRELRGMFEYLDLPLSTLELELSSGSGIPRAR